MLKWTLWLALAASLHAATNAELTEQVRQTETAFAKTMADRDAAAFTTFLADETIFMSDGQVLRGSKQVAEQWKPLFQGPKAAFSWKPELVEVLDSGNLAMTSGPVLDGAGNRVGTFNSVWRRAPDGSWKIVMDNGCPACNCSKNAK
jgi:ketosteroid isomerase-like protein